MARIQPLVGMRLFGFCGGEFGRDSYDEKIIEFVGYDYIIVRENGEPEFAKTYDKTQFLVDEKWLTDEY